MDYGVGVKPVGINRVTPAASTADIYLEGARGFCHFTRLELLVNHN